MTATNGQTMLTGARGVPFEEYDLPEVKIEDGISATGDLREAWFRDPDGNILRIHSHIES